MKIELLDITSDNWRAVAAVRPTESQAEFVADPTYYMCLSHYGEDWTSLAVTAGGEVVGHVMWAYDDEEAATWLGGLLIDAPQQGKGFGRASVEAFLDRFAPDEGSQVALSFHPRNTVARQLYARLGFVETGETEDDELVARFHRS